MPRPQAWPGSAARTVRVATRCHSGGSMATARSQPVALLDDHTAPWTARHEPVAPLLYLHLLSHENGRPLRALRLDYPVALAIASLMLIGIVQQQRHREPAVRPALSSCSDWDDLPAC